MSFRFSLAAGLSLALFTAGGTSAESQPASYYSQVRPILKRSCSGCHNPAKMKGDLDVTTVAAILKGGKHGAVVKNADPGGSRLIEEISGDDPSMPKDGDPLTKEEVALFEKWISEGAKDDTPADKLNPYKLSEPPKYMAPGVIPALAFAPDGKLLAIAGYHEVLLENGEDKEILGRLVGESPKVESFAFSSDGKLLAVSGGAPAVFGEVQIWDVAARKEIGAYRISLDSVYGISFSPDNTKVAVGGADKVVRILNVADGKQLVKFDNHSDWVFGTTFTVDGKRLLSGSRDRAMKLINTQDGQFIDDINKLLEPVLCFSRNPKQDIVAYGGALGNARIYRISENQGRTAANNDNNLLKEFERQPGPIYAISYSPDGNSIALGGTGSEVLVFKTDGHRTATLAGHEGAVFSIAWNPAKPEILTAGLEGKIRVFDPASGKLLREFIPFPLEKSEHVAAN
jgi:WD40 repeat protein